uniref:Uncharacterized protein n=1 Tax=Onchocerca volvulus TaxID=6282 RepID=A0A8R1XUK6_ONCVO
MRNFLGIKTTPEIAPEMVYLALSLHFRIRIEGNSGQRDAWQHVEIIKVYNFANNSSRDYD